MTQKTSAEITVRNLNLTYGGQKSVPALKDINVDIPKNRLTAVLGPSGCGKTTFLKTLNRLHEIKDNVKTSGEIYIGGEDIYHPSQPVPELRRKVGLVSQKPYPLPASIYENIAYGPRIHDRPGRDKLDEIVENCLRRVGLWKEVNERLSAPAADLSIGQQQRLCLARTLAVDPEVILCDEVTSALDPISSEKIEDLLLSLKKTYTIVLVTHILRQAERLADHVIFLYLGEVVETGKADEVFTSPKQEKTQKYLSGLMAGV